MLEIALLDIGHSAVAQHLLHLPVLTLGAPISNVLQSKITMLHYDAWQQRSGVSMPGCSGRATHCFRRSSIRSVHCASACKVRGMRRDGASMRLHTCVSVAGMGAASIAKFIMAILIHLP